MINVKVEKLSRNNNSYRTPVHELDLMPMEPIIGRHLTLGSSTHETNGISTSIVNKIENTDDGWIVHTKFSTYKITRIEENSCLKN